MLCLFCSHFFCVLSLKLLFALFSRLQISFFGLCSSLLLLFTLFNWLQIQLMTSVFFLLNYYLLYSSFFKLFFNFSTYEWVMWMSPSFRQKQKKILEGKEANQILFADWLTWVLLFLFVCWNNELFIRYDDASSQLIVLLLCFSLTP